MNYVYYHIQNNFGTEKSNRFSASPQDPFYDRSTSSAKVLFFRFMVYKNPFFCRLLPLEIPCNSMAQSTRIIDSRMEKGGDKNAGDKNLIKNASLEVYLEPGPNGEKIDESLSVECDGVLGKHNLRVVCWSPAIEPYSIVVISHGLHEHALRYYGIAHELTARGVIVYACDHYSHGKSPGVRGCITDYNVLISDFPQFVQWARNRHPDLPLSVLGHSMGSMIAMMSIRHIDDLKSVVFSGVPLVPGPGVSSPLGCTCLYPLSRTALAPHLTACLAGCMPTGPCAPLDIDGVSSDPQQRALLLADSLRYPGDVMNVTAREMVKLVECCRQEASSITIPFLQIHGAADSIALPEGAQWFFDNAATIPAAKQIHIFPLARHELFHEVGTLSQRALQLVGEYLSEGVAESLQNSLIGEGKEFYNPSQDNSKETSKRGVTGATQIDIEMTDTK